MTQYIPRMLYYARFSWIGFSVSGEETCQSRFVEKTGSSFDKHFFFNSSPTQRKQSIDIDISWFDIML